LSLFKKKTAASPESGGNGQTGKNNLSLLILLVLVGAFAYLYFFTSLIVPHEAAPPPKADAPAAVLQVKQSMPPRPADKVEAAAPANGEATKPGEAKPAPAATAQLPPTSPAVAPTPVPVPKKEAPKPANVAEQKPAPAVPKKEEPKAVKPPEKKSPEKAVAAKDKQPAPAPPAKTAQKTASAETNGQVAKPVAAPAAATAEKVQAKKKVQTFTLFAGEFPVGSEADAVVAKLNKFQIKPVLKQVSKKNRQMNRLFVNSFSDYDSYTAELEKLKQVSKGAFAIEKDGKYSIYAGSFSTAALAGNEKKRLAGKGVKVELQQVMIPSSAAKITAGSFQGKAEADKAVAQLKKQGLAVKVITKGK